MFIISFLLKYVIILLIFVDILSGSSPVRFSEAQVDDQPNPNITIDLNPHIRSLLNSLSVPWTIGRIGGKLKRLPADDSRTDSRLEKSAGSDSRLEKSAASDSRLEKSAASDSRLEKSAASDSRREISTTSDSRREMSPASDSRRKISTASDSRLEMSAASDSRCEMSTASDSRRKISTASDSRLEMSTASDSRRKISTASDSRLEMSTASDSRREISTASDSRLEMSTASDSRREMSTASDSRREMSTASDSRREMSTASDSRREMSTASDSRREMSTASDSRREIPAASDCRIGVANTILSSTSHNPSGDVPFTTNTCISGIQSAISSPTSDCQSGVVGSKAIALENDIGNAFKTMERFVTSQSSSNKMIALESNIGNAFKTMEPFVSSQSSSNKMIASERDIGNAFKTIEPFVTSRSSSNKMIGIVGDTSTARGTMASSTSHSTNVESAILLERHFGGFRRTQSTATTDDIGTISGITLATTTTDEIGTISRRSQPTATTDNLGNNRRAQPRVTTDEIGTISRRTQPTATTDENGNISRRSQPTATTDDLGIISRRAQPTPTRYEIGTISRGTQPTATTDNLGIISRRTEPPAITDEIGTISMRAQPPATAVDLGKISRRSKPTATTVEMGTISKRTQPTATTDEIGTISMRAHQSASTVEIGTASRKTELSASSQGSATVESTSPSTAVNSRKELSTNNSAVNSRKEMSTIDSAVNSRKEMSTNDSQPDRSAVPSVTDSRGHTIASTGNSRPDAESDSKIAVTDGRGHMVASTSNSSPESDSRIVIASAILSATSYDRSASSLGSNVQTSTGGWRLGSNAQRGTMSTGGYRTDWKSVNLNSSLSRNITSRPSSKLYTATRPSSSTAIGTPRSHTEQSHQIQQSHTAHRKQSPERNQRTTESHTLHEQSHGIEQSNTLHHKQSPESNQRTTESHTLLEQSYGIEQSSTKQSHKSSKNSQRTTESQTLLEQPHEIEQSSTKQSHKSSKSSQSTTGSQTLLEQSHGIEQSSTKQSHKSSHSSQRTTGSRTLLGQSHGIEQSSTKQSHKSSHSSQRTTGSDTLLEQSHGMEQSSTKQSHKSSKNFQSTIESPTLLEQSHGIEQSHTAHQKQSLERNQRTTESQTLLGQSHGIEQPSTKQSHKSANKSRRTTESQTLLEQSHGIQQSNTSHQKQSLERNQRTTESQALLEQSYGMEQSSTKQSHKSSNKSQRTTESQTLLEQSHENTMSSYPMEQYFETEKPYNYSDLDHSPEKQYYEPYSPTRLVLQQYVQTDKPHSPAVESYETVKYDLGTEKISTHSTSYVKENIESEKSNHYISHSYTTVKQFFEAEKFSLLGVPEEVPMGDSQPFILISQPLEKTDQPAISTIHYYSDDIVKTEETYSETEQSHEGIESTTYTISKLRQLTSPEEVETGKTASTVYNAKDIQDGTDASTVYSAKSIQDGTEKSKVFIEQPSTKSYRAPAWSYSTKLDRPSIKATSSSRPPEDTSKPDQDTLKLSKDTSNYPKDIPNPPKDTSKLPKDVSKLLKDTFKCPKGTERPSKRDRLLQFFKLKPRLGKLSKKNIPILFPRKQRTSAKPKFRYDIEIGVSDEDEEYQGRKQEEAMGKYGRKDMCDDVTLHYENERLSTKRSLLNPHQFHVKFKYRPKTKTIERKASKYGRDRSYQKLNPSQNEFEKKYLDWKVKTDGGKPDRVKRPDGAKAASDFIEIHHIEVLKPSQVENVMEPEEKVSKNFVRDPNAEIFSFVHNRQQKVDNLDPANDMGMTTGYPVQRGTQSRALNISPETLSPELEKIAELLLRNLELKAIPKHENSAEDSELVNKEMREHFLKEEFVKGQGGKTGPNLYRKPSKNITVDEMHKECACKNKDLKRERYKNTRDIGLSDKEKSRFIDKVLDVNQVDDLKREQEKNKLKPDVLPIFYFTGDSISYLGSLNKTSKILQVKNETLERPLQAHLLPDSLIRVFPSIRPITEKIEDQKVVDQRTTARADSDKQGGIRIQYIVLNSGDETDDRDIEEEIEITTKTAKIPEYILFPMDLPNDLNEMPPNTRWSNGEQESAMPMDENLPAKKIGRVSTNHVKEGVIKMSKTNLTDEEYNKRVHIPTNFKDGMMKRRKTNITENQFNEISHHNDVELKKGSLIHDVSELFSVFVTVNKTKVPLGVVNRTTMHEFLRNTRTAISYHLDDRGPKRKSASNRTFGDFNPFKTNQNSSLLVSAKSLGQNKKPALSLDETLKKLKELSESVCTCKPGGHRNILKSLGMNTMNLRELSAIAKEYPLHVLPVVNCKIHQAYYNMKRTTHSIINVPNLASTQFKKLGDTAAKEHEIYRENIDASNWDQVRIKPTASYCQYCRNYVPTTVSNSLNGLNNVYENKPFNLVPKTEHLGNQGKKISQKKIKFDHKSIYKTNSSKNIDAHLGLNESENQKDQTQNIFGNNVSVLQSVNDFTINKVISNEHLNNPTKTKEIVHNGYDHFNHALDKLNHSNTMDSNTQSFNEKLDPLKISFVGYPHTDHKQTQRVLGIQQLLSKVLTSIDKKDLEHRRNPQNDKKDPIHMLFLEKYCPTQTVKHPYLTPIVSSNPDMTLVSGNFNQPQKPSENLKTNQADNKLPANIISVDLDIEDLISMLKNNITFMLENKMPSEKKFDSVQDIQTSTVSEISQKKLDIPNLQEKLPQPNLNVKSEEPQPQITKYLPNDHMKQTDTLNKTPEFGLVYDDQVVSTLAQYLKAQLSTSTIGSILDSKLETRESIQTESPTKRLLQNEITKGMCKDCLIKNTPSTPYPRMVFENTGGSRTPGPRHLTPRTIGNTRHDHAETTHPTKSPNFPQQTTVKRHQLENNRDDQSNTGTNLCCQHLNSFAKSTAQLFVIEINENFATTSYGGPSSHSKHATSEINTMSACFSQDIDGLGNSIAKSSRTMISTIPHAKETTSSEMQATSPARPYTGAPQQRPPENRLSSNYETFRRECSCVCKEEKTGSFDEMSIPHNLISIKLSKVQLTTTEFAGIDRSACSCTSKGNTLSNRKSNPDTEKDMNPCAVNSRQPSTTNPRPKPYPISSTTNSPKPHPTIYSEHSTNVPEIYRTCFRNGESASNNYETYSTSSSKPNTIPYTADPKTYTNSFERKERSPSTRKIRTPCTNPLNPCNTIKHGKSHFHNTQFTTTKNDEYSRSASQSKPYTVPCKPKIPQPFSAKSDKPVTVNAFTTKNVETTVDPKLYATTYTTNVRHSRTHNAFTAKIPHLSTEDQNTFQSNGPWNNTNTQTLQPLSTNYDKNNTSKYPPVYATNYPQVYSTNYPQVYTTNYPQVYSTNYPQVYTTNYPQIYTTNYPQIYTIPSNTKLSQAFELDYDCLQPCAHCPFKSSGCSASKLSQPKASIGTTLSPIQRYDDSVAKRFNFVTSKFWPDMLTLKCTKDLTSRKPTTPISRDGATQEYLKIPQIEGVKYIFMKLLDKIPCTSTSNFFSLLEEKEKHYNRSIGPTSYSSNSVLSNRTSHKGSQQIPNRDCLCDTTNNTDETSFNERRNPMMKLRAFLLSTKVSKDSKHVPRYKKLGSQMVQVGLLKDTLSKTALEKSSRKGKDKVGAIQRKRKNNSVRPGRRKYNTTSSSGEGKAGNENVHGEKDEENASQEETAMDGLNKKYCVAQTSRSLQYKSLVNENVFLNMHPEVVNVSNMANITQNYENFHPTLANATMDFAYVTMNLVHVSPKVVNVTPKLVSVTSKLVNVTAKVVFVTPKVVNVTPKLINVTPKLVNRSSLVNDTSRLVLVTSTAYG